MFRHVEIEYILFRKKHLIKTWCRHFIVFLQILINNSQLISVKFEDLSYCFENIDTSTYDDIYRTIDDFLVSRHHLKRAEFPGCFFRFHKGVELLRKLTENSSESLTHLPLRKFVHYEPKDKDEDSKAAQKLPTLANLPSLTTLKIDYSLRFENIIAFQSDVVHVVHPISKKLPNAGTFEDNLVLI
ncbi:hypothetical protein AVEN_67759-1 [Araneus ventricosus]|uniref:Uncharacterized protein n=1 Tax=Araneus ventricosus TaxID=182803 RepID=A0A4Y2UP26_ARAVE|nr:hypothetical protein AVEN_67759-1 [Araneus ventricosus]